MTAPEDRTWPGRVFEDAEVAYESAMHAFVRASAPVLTTLLPDEALARPTLGPDEAAARRREQRRLARERGAARGRINDQRKHEDAVWRALNQAYQQRPVPALADQAALAVYHEEEAQWRALRQERRAVLARRAEEDAHWRAERQHLRAQRPSTEPEQTAWIAVLVITDSCTRRCVGLPLFVAGPKITAACVVDALRTLLPAGLQFLISDRGTHFTAHAFARFAVAHGFVHVSIARHRPQSNGIAERFVRTLKDWLADQTWTGAEDLATLLDRFHHEYNDRPHQGLPIPGLSPNEYARRLWLL